MQYSSRNVNCPKCHQPVDAAQKYCAACGAALGGPKPWYRRPKAVVLAGQLTASVLSGAVGAMIALLLAFYVFTPGGRPLFGSSNVVVVTAAPFEERTALGSINASSLLPYKDSTFLIVDDLTDDAFYELQFFADGRKAQPLLRHSVAGLAPGMVEDFEGSTIVDVDGNRYMVAVSSLEKVEGENTEDGLVRIAVGEDGRFTGEAMSGFRAWLIANNPSLGELAGGADALDVQGLAWDPNLKVLLVGIRSATKDRRPLVLSVRVKDWSGPWTVGNLEALEPVSLAVADSGKPKGIYSLVLHPTRQVVYAVVRDSDGRSGSAELYEWNPAAGGAVKLVPDIVFHPAMRPEGLAFGTIGGRSALVIVDDNGGYAVLWTDELPVLAG